jgi:hypothetical protein
VGPGPKPLRAAEALRYLYRVTSMMDGLWMVGDSVFPGQSTLATALGGSAHRGVHRARVTARLQSPSKRTPAAFASATSFSTFSR